MCRKSPCFSHGECQIWSDIAGGNSFHVSTHEGRSIELMHFCFQYASYPITDDVITDVMEDMGLCQELENLEEERAEDYTSLETLILHNHKDLQNVIEEATNRAREYEVEEYSIGQAEENYYSLLEDYKRYADMEEVA